MFSKRFWPFEFVPCGFFNVFTNHLDLFLYECLFTACHFSTVLFCCCSCACQRSLCKYFYLCIYAYIHTFMCSYSVNISPTKVTSLLKVLFYFFDRNVFLAIHLYIELKHSSFSQKHIFSVILDTIGQIFFHYSFISQYFRFFFPFLHEPINFIYPLSYLDSVWDYIKSQNQLWEEWI